jgi:hypothetical protein
MIKKTTIQQRFHTLDELLSSSPEDPPPLTAEEREWLDAPEVGNEFPNNYPLDEE